MPSLTDYHQSHRLHPAQFVYMTCTPLTSDRYNDSTTRLKEVLLLPAPLYPILSWGRGRTSVADHKMLTDQEQQGRSGFSRLSVKVIMQRRYNWQSKRREDIYLTVISETAGLSQSEWSNEGVFACEKESKFHICSFFFLNSFYIP